MNNTNNVSYAVVLENNNKKLRLYDANKGRAINTIFLPYPACGSPSLGGDTVTLILQTGPNRKEGYVYSLPRLQMKQKFNVR